jgi:endo-1,4-beta-xylanase
MDVALPTDENGNVRDANDLQKQAEIYRQIATVCRAHPNCTAIQTWGFTDKYSWIRSSTKGAKGAALLFDRNYAKKPAYAALKNALVPRSDNVATAPVR